MTLEDCRRFYAEEIRLAAHVRSPAVVEAFARVPREKFLGPGPWRIAAVVGLGTTAYVSTEDADPRHVYHNVLVALDETRALNNGQPGALASWIDALDLKPGDRVFHVGCGVGYYTAVMAEVTGATGRIIASEVDPDLARRARENLAGYANVEVHAADGATVDPGGCDAVLINAGVTHPHGAWLECLRESGRMVLPLTAGMGALAGRGVMLRVARQGDAFAATAITFVMIYPCSSTRDPRLEPALAKALGSGALLKIRSVRRDTHEPSDTCVVHGREVCMSLAGPEDRA